MKTLSEYSIDELQQEIWARTPPEDQMVLSIKLANKMLNEKLLLVQEINNQKLIIQNLEKEIYRLNRELVFMDRPIKIKTNE